MALHGRRAENVDFWIGKSQSFWRLYTKYSLYNYELFDALCVVPHNDEHSRNMDKH